MNPISDADRQYAVRQRKATYRRSNRVALYSFLATLALFALAFKSIFDSTITAMYQTVLDSSGRIQFTQLFHQDIGSFLIASILAFVFVWCVMLMVGLAVVGKPRIDFDFEGVGAPRQTNVVPSSPRPTNFTRLTPHGFEEAVADLIIRRTGHHAVVVGRTGDGGVDVEVYDGNRRLIGIVQCKHYQAGRALPPEHVRALASVKYMRNVNVAYLATTAHFSPATRREAERLGIRLIEGRDLKRMSMSPHVNRGGEIMGIQEPAQPPKPVEDFDRSMNGMWADSPASATPVNSSHWQPPKKPTTEQARIRQQLEERRRRLKLPKP